MWLSVRRGCWQGRDAEATTVHGGRAVSDSSATNGTEGKAAPLQTPINGNMYQTVVVVTFCPLLGQMEEDNELPLYL